MRKPRIITISACVPSIPFEAGLRVMNSDGESNLSIARVTGLLLLFSAAVQWRICFRGFSAAFLALAGYLVVLGVQAVLAPRELLAECGLRMFMLVQMALACFIAFNIFRHLHGGGAYWWFFGLGCGVVSVLQVSGLSTPDQVTEAARVSAFGEDPNSMGNVIGIGILCLLFTASESLQKCATASVFSQPAGRAVAILSCLALPAMLLALVQTGSRGAMLSLAPGLLVWVASGLKLRTIVVKALVAGATAALVMVFVVNSPSIDRWFRLIDHRDTAGRDVLHATTLRMAVEKPVFGYGPVRGWYALGEKVGDGYRAPHNTYLEALLSGGMVGAILFCGFIGACAVPALRTFLAGRSGLPAGLLTAVVTTCMGLNWDNRKVFWMVLAFCLAQVAARTQRARTLPSTIGRAFEGCVGGGTQPSVGRGALDGSQV